MMMIDSTYLFSCFIIILFVLDFACENTDLSHHGKQDALDHPRCCNHDNKVNLQLRTRVPAHLTR